MARSITEVLQLARQAVSDEEERILRNYNEARLASSDVEREYGCISAAATDGSSNIYIWTHASFIEKVAYYPFIYKYVETHGLKMVYADSSSRYVMPIYYV